MKVAIIGAGLAGLSCAHELEKYGISPVIYERNAFIGEQVNHVGAIIEVVHRPVKDYLKYFKDEFNIIIKPLDTVNNIIHYSPNKRRDIKGDLGYFFKRGKDKDSVKNQIFSQIKNPNIKFNTCMDYTDLIKKYDYVVIANGSISSSRELGCFQTWVKGYVRGATVHGDFKTNEMFAWINKEYCKNGYAYLTPFNNKMASLILIATNVFEKEIDYFWDRFLYTENIKFTIVEEFKLEHISGYTYPNRVGNIFLVGNASGMVDPFLGFGQISAISMGAFAARTIAAGIDYENQLKNLIEKNLQLIEFRQAYDKLTNKDLDRLVMSLALPGLKHILYDSSIDVIKYLGETLKLLNKINIKES